MGAGDGKSGNPLSRSGETRPAAPAGTGAVEAFLEEARALAPAPLREGRGRLVFALDATMSRQPTWDLARGLQVQMFEAASDVGGLDVQLVYFRGLGECRASRWVGEPKALGALMTGLEVRGGQTQIARTLSHIRKEARDGRVDAFVYVGDAFEDEIDTVCARAGELGLLGVKGFVFQEGGDASAERAFREMAKLTGGAYARFDAGAGQTLAGLLRAAAAYASGGRDGLARLAAREPQARSLLADMSGGGGR